MDTGELTRTEVAVLLEIVEYKRQNDGNSPTLRDLVKPWTAKSTSTITYNLNALERKGFIVRAGHGKAAQIWVTNGQWRPPAYVADLTVDKEEARAKRSKRRRVESLLPEVKRETCRNCHRPFAGSYERKGLCNACAAYRHRTGRHRPKRLIKKMAPMGWCDCGMPAVEELETNVGTILLCEDCLKLETLR